MLSAILYLGNVTYKKKSTGREEGLEVGPPEVLATLSELLKVRRERGLYNITSVCHVGLSMLTRVCLQVKEELLVEALTKRKTVTVNDKLILPYSHNEVGPSTQVISATCHYLYHVKLQTCHYLPASLY